MRRTPLQRRTPLRTAPAIQCCGKKSYATREAAEAALYRITRNPRTIVYPQRVYECRNGWFHLTKSGDRDTGPDTETRRLVWNRDQGRCGVCGQGLKGRQSAVHHRRNRGSGGSSDPAINLPSNLLEVCDGPESCHQWIGSNPAEAYEVGYMISLNSRQATCQVPLMHAVHGWVVLLDNGSFAPPPDWRGAA